MTSLRSRSLVLEFSFQCLDLWPNWSSRPHAPTAKWSHLRLGTSEGSSEESIFITLNSTTKVQFSLLKFSKYKATPPFLRSSEFSDSHFNRIVTRYFIFNEYFLELLILLWNCGQVSAISLPLQVAYNIRSWGPSWCYDSSMTGFRVW